MQHPALEALADTFPVVLCYVATLNGFIYGNKTYGPDIRMAKPFVKVDEALACARAEEATWTTIVFSTPATYSLAGKFYVATKYGFLNSATTGHAVKNIRHALAFPYWEQAQQAGASMAARMQSKGKTVYWAILGE